MYSNLPSLYLKLLVHEITAPCGPFSGLIQTYSYNFLVFKKKLKNKNKNYKFFMKGWAKKKLWLTLNSVAEPHTRVGGQSFKKLFYSIYIIYILKNVAGKNWSWPSQFWVISMVLLIEREIILKSYNLRGLTN